MENYTRKASVFVPNYTSEASLSFSNLNEKIELISIRTKIDEQKKLNEQSELISISNKIDYRREWICANLVRYRLPSSICRLHA